MRCNFPLLSSFLVLILWRSFPYYFSQYLRWSFFLILLFRCKGLDVKIVGSVKPMKEYPPPWLSRTRKLTLEILHVTCQIYQVMNLHILWKPVVSHKISHEFYIHVPFITIKKGFDGLAKNEIKNDTKDIAKCKTACVSGNEQWTMNNELAQVLQHN